MLRLLPMLLVVWVSGCQLDTFPAPNSDGNSGNPPSSETPDPNNPSFEKGDVILRWYPPVERVNGELMLPSEIGGYEIRYKPKDDAHFQSVVLDASFIPPYVFNDIDFPDNMIFEIAVFDTDGIYSDFVRAVAN